MMSVKIEIKIDDLEMSDEAKSIVSNYKNIPVMMITQKSAIVDEMYFITNNVAYKEQKAIFEYAIALNKHLNKSN